MCLIKLVPLNARRKTMFGTYDMQWQRQPNACLTMTSSSATFLVFPLSLPLSLSLTYTHSSHMLLLLTRSSSFHFLRRINCWGGQGHQLENGDKVWLLQDYLCSFPFKTSIPNKRVFTLTNFHNNRFYF
jgi:hypothetical protein